MRVCMRICQLPVFFDHVSVTPLNTPEYALDSRARTLVTIRALTIGGHFMGHLAKPVFAIAFGKKFTNQVLLLPTAMSLKELLTEKTWGRLTLYKVGYKSAQQYYLSNKEPMSYPWRAAGVRVFRNNWTSTWLVSCFCLLISLFVDLLISLWSILFNSLSN